jgi:RNA polymerase sigma factor (sigma-70 family)
MRKSSKEKEFRKAYSDYYPVIVNAIYSRVGNLEDAEDICHEIFVHFYNKYEEIQDCRKWLFGAIKYGISNFYRKKGASDKGNVNIDSIDFDKNLAFENGFRDIRIIINETIEDESNYQDEKERILFDLVAINKYTYEQAAKQLGWSTRQVAYRYQQISKRIVSCLKQKGITRIEDLI